MGEAYYYGKIRFKTEEAAQAAYPEIKALIEDTYKAGEYWQANRGRPDGQAFWAGMEEAFPKASEYLKTCGRLWGGDHNNGLAGMLDLIGNEYDIEDIRLDDNEIRWCSEVWHFAEWEPFKNFIESKYDCKMRWLSDEYMDYWALVDLEFED